MRRHVVTLLAFLLVAGIYASGLLDALEFSQMEARFRIAKRAPDPAIVIVAIDGDSLQQLATWPWPRSWHAQLVDNLAQAGAARIAFDIDFSARSEAAEDAAFARSLAALGPRAILTVFQQPAASRPGGFVSSAPLPELIAQARVGSVNLRIAPDGLVRQAERRSAWRDQTVPSLPVLLADQALGDKDAPFFIDFGIRPAAPTVLRYLDVLSGTFDPSLVAGKTVLVGATAVELGGLVPVPVLDTAPGVIVEALAAQSLLLGRDLTRIPEGPTLGLAALLLLACRWLMLRLDWRLGLAATLVLCPAGFGAATALQAAAPLLLDAVPLQLAVIAAFLATLLERVEGLDLLVSAHARNLRRKETQLRLFAESTFDGLMIFDGAGRLGSLNPAAQRMFGRPEGEALGKPPGRFFADGGEAAATLEALAALGRNREIEGLRQDGSTFAGDIAVSRLAGDADQGYVVLVRDLSAQRRAERTAETLGRRLHDAVESISEGFALFDADERLVLCNSRMREFYAAAAPAFAPGTPFAGIMAAFYGTTLDPAAAADRTAQRLREFRGPGQDFFERLSGGRWVRGSDHRLADGGTVTVLTDISEIKRREQELIVARDMAGEASRSKSRFLANMSHELRTPLNAILGFSETMKEETLGPVGNPVYRDYAGDIFTSGHHLLSIINDILDLSQIEAGKMALKEIRFVPAEVAAAALDLVRNRAAKGGIQLRSEIAPDLPELLADQRMVTQILSNLLSNAVKFTPAGGTVTLSAQRSGSDGGLVFTVSDTGIGIAQDDLARIMQPFEQVEIDWARHYEGSGLGLPIVSALANLHGGAFSLFSEPGKGTVAAVAFPASRWRRN